MKTLKKIVLEENTKRIQRANQLIEDIQYLFLTTEKHQKKECYKKAYLFKNAAEKKILL